MIAHGLHGMVSGVLYMFNEGFADYYNGLADISSHCCW